MKKGTKKTETENKTPKKTIKPATDDRLLSTRILQDFFIPLLDEK